MYKTPNKYRFSFEFRVTAQTLITGMIGQLLLLISGPLLARLLGVEGRGYFAGLTAWCGFITALGSLSIPLSCTHIISKDPKNVQNVIRSAYKIAKHQILILLLILLFVLLYWSHKKPINIRLSVYPMLLFVPSTIILEYILAILQGQHRFALFNSIRLIPTFIYVIIILILFLMGENSILIIVSIWMAITTLFVSILAFVSLKNRKKHIKPYPIKDIISFGAQSHIGAIAPLSYLKIDQIAVAMFLSVSNLGIYTVAYSFTNLFKMIAQSIGMVAFPIASKNINNKYFIHFILKYIMYVTILYIVIFVLMFSFIPMLIKYFFGPEFSDSIIIAKILIISAACSSLSKVLTEILRGFGYAKLSSMSEIAIYPWFFTGGLYLMFRYGIKGLSMGLTIGYVISLIVMAIVFYNLVVINNYRRYKNENGGVME